MFRASSAHFQKDTVVYMQHMVMSLSTGVKLCTDWPPRTPVESDIAICCMYTTVSSWRWALEVRNM